MYRNGIYINKYVYCIVCAVTFASVMGGCAPARQHNFIDSDNGYPSGQNTADVWVIEDEPLPLAEEATKVLKPVAPGTVVYTSGTAAVDASNASEGYIMVKYSSNVQKIKVQVTKSGQTTYTYDLNNQGKYEVLPLTNGDGKYKIEIFENVSGTSYATVLSTSVEVELRNSLLPFLYPNQYVNFNKDSQVVEKSNKLSGEAANDLGIVSNIYNYVINNITYDTQKAATVKPGYLPKVDSILASGKGICFDYASLMAAMLRAQGIPTRLEVGYVSSGVYHAWISVYITDVGWVNSVIYFDGASWKLMDPTFASSGGQSSSIMQYIGNGSNYSTKYRY